MPPMAILLTEFSVDLRYVPILAKMGWAGDVDLSESYSEVLAWLNICMSTQVCAPSLLCGQQHGSHLNWVWAYPAENVYVNNSANTSTANHRVPSRATGFLVLMKKNSVTSWRYYLHVLPSSTGLYHIQLLHCWVHYANSGKSGTTTGGCFIQRSKTTKPFNGKKIYPPKVCTKVSFWIRV